MYWRTVFTIYQEIKRGPLNLEIQWSHTTDWLLETCQRRFWFEKIKANPKARWGSSGRETFILAKVQTYELWRGNLVHSIISDYFIPQLQQGASPSPDELKAYALNQANRQLGFSARKQYREMGMTRTKAGLDYAILWEDEFSSTTSSLTREQALADIELAVGNLYSLSGFINKLLQHEWVKPEITIRLDSHPPVTGRIDLMAVSRAASLNLVDWKLDRSQRYHNAPQLWVYAFLLETDANKRTYKDANYQLISVPDWLEARPKNLIEVNLLQGSVIEHCWNDARKRQVEDRVFKGIRKIRTLLDGRKPNQISGGEFSVTNNSTNCDRCPFRQPCQSIVD